ncbi:MAG: hypothetical protein D6677_13415 [Calditrichaeota bacterium]|nr:MAG: hypothetical protein D6677_13415 [Calditrichota bacterium]
MYLKHLYRTGFLDFYRVATDATPLERPYYEGGVRAGFPSPADDFSEAAIDLNRELVKNPASTFFCRVSGDSMRDVGIGDGDLLVVDKSLQPRDGSIAVCFIDGAFTLKRIKVERDCCWLIPAHPDYEPIRVTPDNEFVVWGIVTYSIKAF